MATTTNYSWSTPDDTALVKDGAAAIRSLGTAIDTTVFNNAGAAIAKTIVDAKGDIIAATAADTVSRLAVGANDTVLTADSTAATGLKWATAAAGGMTLISTTTLTGASVTISSIPSGYNSLELRILNFLPATDNTECRMRINADSNTRYAWSVAAQASDESFAGIDYIPVTRPNDNSVAWGLNITEIPDYASTTRVKYGKMFGVNVSATTTTLFNAQSNVFFYNQLAAITSLVLFPGSGNFTSGTALLYGVK
jgi:hypothetical protein